jgi:hypothetical protein
MAIQLQLNNLLDPVLFQVIGSTPESIRDSILKSNLKGNSKGGAQLAATAVFSAAVNKPTMENFVARPEMYEVRPLINQVFTISGRANMTGLTLLGHCLLTTEQLSGVTFCDKLREKMGQRNIWEGDLESGTLSDAQKKIMKEKCKSIKWETARLLGSCFFKYTALNEAPMTIAETRFWNSLPTIASSPPRAVSQAVTSPTGSPPSVKRAVASLSANTGVVTETINLPKGGVAVVPANILKYYRTVISDDPRRLAESIEKRTPEGFIAEYTEYQRKDPDMKGAAGGSVVG